MLLRGDRFGVQVAIQVLTRKMLSRLAVVLVYVSSLLIWTSFLILLPCSILESIACFRPFTIGVHWLAMLMSTKQICV
jgi:hypothetical protein